MNRRDLFVLTLILAALPGAATASAEAVPTRLRVRAVAQDAHVIYDAVGGARITVRDADTGEVLAEGIQKGHSGDHERIMKTPRVRGATVYDTPGTAYFETVLELARPRRVEVTAEGPLAYPHAMQRASKTLLLVPGQDLVGEGLILTLHGYIVTIEAPAGDEPLAAGGEAEVRATVRML